MTENKGERVLFEVEAYAKALMHVLRFASSAIKPEDWVEVYGWLVGRIEEGDLVHIYDAVPLHHGKDIEVVWDPETYVRASEFDEKLWRMSEEENNEAMKGMFICGWYHSHPGLDFFLSSVDISNHLGFQGPNPHSVAIVFDHTKIVPYKHLGFKIFKLDEPSQHSGFHEVEFDKSVFTRDKLAMIYLMQQLVLNIQSDKPFTTEYGEVPDIFTQLILPRAVPALNRNPPLDINRVFTEITKSTGGFIERVFGTSMVGKIASELNPAIGEWYSSFVPGIFSALNKWLMELAEKLVVINKLSLGSSHTIAETLKKSMKNTMEWMKNYLDEHRRLMKNVAKDDRQKIVKHFDETLARQKSEFDAILERLDGRFETQGVIIQDVSGTISALNEKLEFFKNSIESRMDGYEQKLSSFESRLDAMSETIGTTLNERFNEMQQSFKETISSLDGQVREKIEANYRDVNESIVNLKEAITSEINKVVEALQVERKQFEELVASKAIKNLQKEVKNLSNKVGG